MSIRVSNFVSKVFCGSLLGLALSFGANAQDQGDDYDQDGYDQYDQVGQMCSQVKKCSKLENWCTDKTTTVSKKVKRKVMHKYCNECTTTEIVEIDGRDITVYAEGLDCPGEMKCVKGPITDDLDEEWCDEDDVDQMQQGKMACGKKVLKCAQINDHEDLCEGRKLIKRHIDTVDGKTIITTEWVTTTTWEDCSETDFEAEKCGDDEVDQIPACAKQHG